MKNTEKKIAIPFPAVHYNVEVEYAGAHRAPGVSYILMVLIDNAESLEESISGILNSFDIPKDIFQIFAKELDDMIEKGIIEVDAGVAADMDEESEDICILDCDVRDFRLTSLGRELYQKGMLLSEEKEKKSVALVYNSVEDELSNKTNEVLAIDNDLMSDVEDNWKLFLDKGKNYIKDWVTQKASILGLKKGSQITNITVNSEKIMQSKSNRDLIVSLSDGYAKIEFSSSKQKEFYSKYYNPEIANVFLLKSTGVFNDISGERFVPCELHFNSEITDFYFPSERENVIKSLGTGIAINRKHFFDDIKGKNIINCTETDQLLNAIDDHCELILVNSYDGYGYTPSLVESDTAGRLELLLKHKLSSEKYDKILEVLFDIYAEKDIDKEVLNVMNIIAKADRQERNFLEQYGEKKCFQYNTDEEKIRILTELDQAFSNNADWNDYFKKKISDIFEESLSKTELKDIRYLDAVFKNVYKKLVDEREFYIKIIHNFRYRYADIEIFAAICNIGCKAESVLSELNVIPALVSAIFNNEPVTAENTFTKQFENCRNHFNELKKILDIVECETYPCVRDDYDKDKYIGIYEYFIKDYKKIRENYFYLAENEFKDLENYLSVFAQFHEDAVVFKMAENNPEKLSDEEIEKFIIKGEWTRVISILNYKFQVAAQKILGGQDIAHNMINTLQERNIISLEEKSLLHSFRMCRNGLEHPNVERVPFDANDLRKWKQIILKL